MFESHCLKFRLYKTECDSLVLKMKGNLEESDSLAAPESQRLLYVDHNLLF